MFFFLRNSMFVKFRENKILANISQFAVAFFTIGEDSGRIALGQNFFIS